MNPNPYLVADAIAEMQRLGYLTQETVNRLTAEEYMHVVTTVQREEMLSR